MKSQVRTIHQCEIYYEFDRDDANKCVDKVEKFAFDFSFIKRWNVKIETQGYGAAFFPCVTVQSENKDLLIRCATQIENYIKRFSGYKIS